MTKRTTQLAVESEFDAFLYASIGLENDGTFLSVLSALARRNVDPWDEAARLAGMPREAASHFLANLISAQPDGPVARADPQMQAERLTALLPFRATTSDPVMGGRGQLMRYVIYYVVLTVLFFGSQWIMQNWWGNKSSRAAAVVPSRPEPAPIPAQRLAPNAAPNRD
jgi:hypothetical protein